ncbi:peptidase [Silvibacterium dinghuense]|uniref:Peptidase n=1 Tax=Silvibacterium dinghuense TaxID=1560006 RepID=A0A4Q1SKU0_9BACT|nr:peptidase [Silvibacterium dinghuense]GGG93898.1 peptidase [Silvibacterium dinghuense]
MRRTVAVTARWLHIYLSMLSFAVILFFAATGLTLNHPDWFAGHAKTVETHGIADKAMLHTAGSEGADRLGLVEMLRAREHVHGAVSDFRVDDTQVSISFRAPGYTADAFIDRDTGKYDLTVVQDGFVAVINDLHKGRDAGKAWSAVIDVSAVLLVLVSLTGLVLIWFVYKRRTSGLILAGFAAIAVLMLWKLFVP